MGVVQVFFSVSTYITSQSVSLHHWYIPHGAAPVTWQRTVYQAPTPPSLPLHKRYEEARPPRSPHHDFRHWCMCVLACIYMILCVFLVFHRECIFILLLEWMFFKRQFSVNQIYKLIKNWIWQKAPPLTLWCLSRCKWEHNLGYASVPPTPYTCIIRVCVCEGQVSLPQPACDHVYRVFFTK